MVRPSEIVESLLYVLQNEATLPDAVRFVGYEPDINSESIKLPLVEVSLGIQLEIDESNTDFVGYRTDNDGNQIGRIYETLYEQDLTVSVWTAHGSKYSPRDLGDSLRDALYKYTTKGPGATLPHPELGNLDEVWRVKTTEGTHTDNLGTSPTLRRWQETVIVSASEQYITDSDEKPIDAINARLEQDEDIDGFETSYTVQ